MFIWRTRRGPPAIGAPGCPASRLSLAATLASDDPAEPTVSAATSSAQSGDRWAATLALRCTLGGRRAFQWPWWPGETTLTVTPPGALWRPSTASAISGLVVAYWPRALARHDAVADQHHARCPRAFSHRRNQHVGETRRGIDISAASHQLLAARVIEFAELAARSNAGGMHQRVGIRAPMPAQSYAALSVRSTVRCRYAAWWITKHRRDRRR